MAATARTRRGGGRKWLVRWVRSRARRGGGRGGRVGPALGRLSSRPAVFPRDEALLCGFQGHGRPRHRRPAPGSSWTPSAPTASPARTEIRRKLERGHQEDHPTSIWRSTSTSSCSPARSRRRTAASTLKKLQGAAHRAPTTPWRSTRATPTSSEPARTRSLVIEDSVLLYGDEASVKAGLTAAREGHLGAGEERSGRSTSAASQVEPRGPRHGPDHRRSPEACARC